MDTDAPEWKGLGTLDNALTEVIIEAVGGIATKVKVGIKEVIEKVKENIIR